MRDGLVGQGAEPLRASVESGRRAAAGFVSVPWVRDQLRELLGRDPFPGTLNLHLREPGSLAAWRRYSSRECGLTMPAAEPGFCDSSYFPVLLNGAVPCGIVQPQVPGYPADVVELVAGESLRERLGLQDGDEVSIEWAPAYRTVSTHCVPAHNETAERRMSPERLPCDHAGKERRHDRGLRGPGAEPLPPNDGGRRGSS